MLNIFCCKMCLCLESYWITALQVSLGDIGKQSYGKCAFTVFFLREFIYKCKLPMIYATMVGNLECIIKYIQCVPRDPL